MIHPGIKRKIFFMTLKRKYKLYLTIWLYISDKPYSEEFHVRRKYYFADFHFSIIPNLKL